MTKRRVVLTLVLCSSMALLAVQALPQAPSSRASAAERSRGTTDAERKREIEKQRKETKLARERRKRESEKKSAERKRQYAQKAKELAKEGRGPLIDREQRFEEFQKRIAEIRKEFLYEKYALGATEEQWKVIKAKLEKVRRLHGGVSSTAGLVLVSSSSSGANTGGSRGRSAPKWQWKKGWEGKAPGELNEGQKIAEEIMALLEKRNTKPEEFRRKMDALRKSRSREQIEKKKEELSKGAAHK